MIDQNQTPRRAQTQRRAMGEVVPFRTAAAASSQMPTFTWEALEHQLADLAVSPTQRRLVETLVSATRKQAAFKPAESVLREVLCIASVLMDETFHPESGPQQRGEGEMT